MTSELESLRQRIIELEAENSKLKQIIEENARRDAENAEHKVRIEELEKNSVDISAENAELKAELAKLRHDFNSSNLTRPQQPQHVTNMQNSCSAGEEEISAVPQPYASHDIPDPVIDRPINGSPSDNANIKPSEEEMMVSFLDEVNKKIVSDGIRQRKRDEKLAKVEPISPEKDKQVSVNKKTLRKKEQREKFIQEASEDSSTKCSNTMGEPGSNSLDVCLKQSVRSCDSSAVKMGTTFSLLYKKLLDAEDFADRAVQEAIICYCQFGKALIQRRSEIASEKQVDPESNAVSRILNMEVRAQLPADTSDALLWKRIEQAKKLWKLFDAIGMDKIYRIHSFSVSSISKMTYEDIQYIIDNMPVDYSIKIESSTCAQPKDTLLSDEKNSELSHPDLGSGSDKKNSELSHTNTSEEQTSGRM
ncbi:hypothetical protein GLOIN_2v1789359 [Rhizophagus clarus]|uniref:Uncharacterized protein n=1 Tax=Rhizophagus clarus TaxID=94130 RepID=A0A8H3LNG1_9GLOM|nr:hypothetical protein GLOIN_2v1789359 [Rhizophagus clarus]